MDRIPGRQSIVAADQAARPLDVLELDLVDDVNDAEEGIEGRFDRVAPLDRGKPVKDFLENLRVGRQGSLSTIARSSSRRAASLFG